MLPSHIRHFWFTVALAAIAVTQSSRGQGLPPPTNTGFSGLDKIYTDEGHCLTDADIRSDNDMPISCWCRDAIADLRYVYSNYFEFRSPRRDVNMAGPILQLEKNARHVCGDDAYNLSNVEDDANWRWPGPEVVRSFPPEEVIARIKSEMRNGKKWRGTPFSVQLVFRDSQNHITRTDTYSRVAWEPCVEGLTKPPCG